MKRPLLGAVLGGLILFVWGAIFHEVLPVGKAGIRAIPGEREAAVRGAMVDAMKERAIYVFPALESGRPTSEDERKAFTARFEAGPGGIIAFDPHPGARTLGGSVFGRLLATDVLTNVLSALVAVFVLFHVSAEFSYPRRVLIAGALGLLLTVAVEAPYWNWYGFPTPYLLSQVLNHVVGWLLAGLVLARFARRA